VVTLFPASIPTGAFPTAAFPTAAFPTATPTIAVLAAPTLPAAFPAAACALLALAVAAVPAPSGSSRLLDLRKGPPAPASTRSVPTAAVAGVGALVGLLALGPAGALAGAVLVAAWHRRRARSRAPLVRSALAAELADALGRIIEELRAGGHPAAVLRGVRTDGPLVRAVLRPAATAAALGEGVAAALAAEAARHPDLGGELQRVARTWALAERHGVAPAELLASVLADLRWRIASAGRVRAQLAGPRATATVLTALPGLGIVLGELIGAEPLAVLRSGLLGQLLVVVGVGLSATGAAWTDRITRAAVPR
jgi:tight adherence protein B